MKPASAASKSYAMPDASVGGGGLTAEFRDAPWEKFRDEIYAHERDLAWGILQSCATDAPS